MRLWQKIGRRRKEVNTASSVGQAVLERASRREICDEIHRVLRKELAAKIDRFGVWLAPEGEYDGSVDPRTFQGRLWDTGARTDEEPGILEWNVLGNIGTPPQQLLTKLLPTEEEVSARAALTKAAVAGMRKALWVPVCLDAQLYGVLFAGSRQKNSSLSREAITRVAAELAIALGFEKRSANLSSALTEQAFQRKVLTQMSEGASLDRLLQEIVDSSLRCAAGGRPSGPFAMIGLRAQQSMAGETRDVEIDFRWTAGDRLWARSAMSEPISLVWQEALATRKMAGREIHAPWAHQDVARIVAIPLFSGAETLGVFVAGLQNSSANLATLERLEMRAGLTALAVERSQRDVTGAGEESVRFFVEHAAEPWFVLDSKLRIAHASEAGKKLLSFRPRSAAQKSELANPAAIRSLGTAAQLFEPEEWQRLVEWMRKISRSEGNSGENSVDGHLRNGGFARLYAAPLPGGGLSLLVHRPTDDHLSESHAATELRSLMEWLDHGVVVFDKQEQVRATNPAFSQFFGLSAFEIENYRSLRELIAALAPRVKEPAWFADRWWHAARGIESGLREEFQVTHPAPRTLERISCPLSDHSGRRIGRIEIYRDVTGPQLLQAKLRNNERLVTLGEKVSGIAHELSNPLTAILGYAQRLLVKTEGSARREEIQNMLAEAERASSIVRQLLDSTSESASELHPLGLNELIQRIVEAHRFQLASEKIRVEVDLADGLPQMLGDAGQLQQILVNLIANARHALLELKRPGSISFRTLLGGSGRILLEVSDSGPGIPEALRHRIFDPFFTTKPAGVGSGLGLSIVAKLVRQHGGHIRLNNPATRGASFLLDFPPVAADIPTLPQLPPAPSVVSRDARVLVVEDEATVAQLIADMLADLGYCSEIQQDARGALISALTRDYELVVCDIKMPGLDGPHFYRALLEIGSSLTSRFLFVTGDVVGSATQEFLKQYGLPYIAKPFRVEEFTERIALVLNEADLSAGATIHDSGFGRENLAGHG